MMAKRYNCCLDFLKGVACICVVFMHCEFPGRLGIIVQAVARFCVPFFFMVSGYYSFKPQSGISNEVTAVFNGKVKHILRITLYACIFYLCFNGLRSLLLHDVNWHVSAGRVFNFLVFNSTFWVAGQYWFLFSLLYTYILFNIVERLKLTKQAYWFAGAMFVVYFILAQGLHLAGVHVPNRIYRNWLIEGFAFFMLGHWIHAHQDNLQIRNSVLYVVFAVSTALCLVERYLMGRDFGVNLVTLPQVFCMFLYAVNNPDRHEGLMQRIGQRYSMFVYILHPAIWHTLEIIYDKVGLSQNMPALYVMPVIVAIATLGVSHLVYLFNKRFQTA